MGKVDYYHRLLCKSAGTMVLNCHPENFFAEVEQVARRTNPLKLHDGETDQAILSHNHLSLLTFSPQTQLDFPLLFLG